MKPFLLAAFVAMTSTLALPAGTAHAEAQLVMVEEHGCAWCERWNTEIAPIYPKTSEGRIAPLRRIDLREAPPPDLEFARAYVFTPTFVLMVDNKEVGRIEGYPGEDFFWALLAQMIETRLTPPSK